MDQQSSFGYEVFQLSGVEDEDLEVADLDVDLEGVDLEGVDLEGLDLEGVDLEGVDLEGAVSLAGSSSGSFNLDGLYAALEEDNANNNSVGQKSAMELLVPEPGHDDTSEASCCQEFDVVSNEMIQHMTNDVPLASFQAHEVKDTRLFDILKATALSVNIFKDCHLSALSSCKKTQREVLYEMRVKNAEKIFDLHKDRALQKDKAKYWFLHGEMYSLSPNHRKEAIECMIKTVKLDPFNKDAWNILGECYFMLGDNHLARCCFKGALNREVNKRSLRNMAVTYRKDSFTLRGVKRCQAAEESIKMAKQATNLDATDGESWSVLGNSYIAAYFSSLSINAHYTRLAVQAYRLADQNGYHSPELFYNTAMAYLYCEMYNESLTAIMRAAEKDPQWELAQNFHTNLTKYLSNVLESLTSHGRIRLKRLKQMIVNLENNMLCGPYISHDPATIKSLHEGKNQKKVLLGKVIWSLQIDRAFPFTIGVMDVNAEIVVVTIYNMVVSKGMLINDTLAIPDPVLSLQEFNLHGKTVKLKKIRVDTPRQLVINNKPLPMDAVGPNTVLFTTFR